MQARIQKIRFKFRERRTDLAPRPRRIADQDTFVLRPDPHPLAVVPFQRRDELSRFVEVDFGDADGVYRATKHSFDAEQSKYDKRDNIPMSRFR